MRLERQAARRREIETAAYEVLAEKGYGSTSMLAIAKRAGASNETLYRWYGSKQALFRSLVEENAREVAKVLREGISAGRDPWGILKGVGPLLLRLLTSEKAVALNRAAVADAEETGVLGRTLAAAGRNSIAPLIAGVLDPAPGTKGEKGAAAEAYINLLVGDLQIRRAIGVLGPLDDADIRRRSDRALRLTKKIFASRNGRPA